MKKGFISNYWKILPAIMIAFALLISGVGMVGSVEPNVNTRGSGMVSGYVYDNETGEVIPDVEIDLSHKESDHSYQDYSDDAGYYEFDDLDAGEYRIRGDDERYYYHKEYFSLSESENREHDIYLDPYECTIFGNVYDADSNDPIEGASVYLKIKEDDYYYYYLHEYTDIEGFYEFFMPPGEYRIDLNAYGYERTSRIIEIKEGEELQEDFFLVPLSTISGILYDGGTSEPLPNIEIDLLEDGWWYSYDYSNETGNYLIYMEAGDYVLRVRERGYEDFEYDFEIKEDEHIVYDIYLEPDLTVLSGYVYNLSSGEAIEGARVSGDNYDTWDRDTTYTDEKGYYELYPGVGEVSISVSKDGYKSEYDSITMEEDVAQERDYYLDPYESSLFGKVYDEETSETISYVYVTVQGEDFYETDYTNSNGEYFIYLDAGEYSVSVSEGGYVTFKTDITVEEWEDYQLDVYLVPFNCKVYGYITNEDGEAIEDAYINIYNDNYSDYYYSDDEGYYEFECPPSSEVGEYNLRVQATDYRPYQEQFWLDQGEELQIDVEMQAQWSPGSVWNWIWELIFG